jgi:hypothetical protein
MLASLRSFALGGGQPDSLFFAGDLGQRIFQTSPASAPAIIPW